MLDTMTRGGIGETAMTIAADLLQRHFETLVDDNARWQTLIADDLVWELPYAPALGHPPRLAGRGEVLHHVTWFLGAVERFRFFDIRLYAFADPQGAPPPSRRDTRIFPSSSGRSSSWSSTSE